MRRGATAILATLLAATVAASSLLLAYAHVAYVYQSGASFQAYYGVGYTPPLYFIVPSTTSTTSAAVAAVPNYCEPAKSLVEALTSGSIQYKYLDYYNASFTAIAYVSSSLVGKQVSLKALLANWSVGGYLVLYMPKGTKVYSAQVSPLSSGQYFTYDYTVTVPAATTTYLGQVNFSPTAIHPGVWFIYSWNLTVVPTTTTTAVVSGDVLDYLFGQTYQTSPLLYQGVSGSRTNSSEPYDLSGTKAANYWSLAGISSTQPVMLLTPDEGSESGVVFWNYAYSSGENLSIVALVTYTAYYSWRPPVPADGIVFYLFVVPYKWSVSSRYNESTYYVASASISGGAGAPLGGDIVFFGAQPYALLVQWEPFYYGNTVYSASGPWNIWVYSYTKSLTREADWYGYGWWSPSSGWSPNVDHYLVLCVTYDGATNTLYGFIEDLNTTQTAGFAVNLNGYFSAPATGTYAFGLGGVTGSAYANWAALYINITKW